MQIWLQLWGILGTVALNVLVTTAHKYEFFFDSEDLFDKCYEITGNNGVHDILDMTNLTLEYNEGTIQMGGEMLLVWNTNPTDRIEFRADVFKYQRGAWQPTLMSLHVKDYCKVQFQSGSIWHTAWSKYIKEEDQKCVNHFHHIYHYNNFNIDAILTLSGNMEGRHKIKIMLEAFDQSGVKNPVSICFEILGELIKLK